MIQSLFVLKRWLFFCRSMCAIFRERVNIRHWPAQHWFDEFRRCWRGLTSGLTNAICRSRLKAGNRYNERRIVGHCEYENALRKMQPGSPNSRQRFLSVIQLLVSFRETLVETLRVRRPADANTPRSLCRGANSRRNSVSFSHSHLFYSSVKRKKLMIPFRCTEYDIPRPAFRWIIIIPIFAETMLYYTTVIWSTETIMSIVASTSRHLRTNFSLEISVPLILCGERKI